MNATREDVSRIVALAKRFHAESNVSEVKFNEAKFAFVVHQFLSEQHSCVICAVSDDGDIAGFLLANVSELFFSTEKAAFDLSFYVRPEQRGTLTAYRLWRAYRHWATSQGARFLHIGTTSGINPEISARFFGGMGMRKVGELYRLDLNEN